MSEKIWSHSYPKGMRWDAPLKFTPVQAILEDAAARFADRPALHFMGKTTTYAELDALACKAAAGFQKLGVGPGVHVGLFLPNSPHYVIAFFGVLKAGGVVVNYSPLDAERVLEHKVGDSETDFMVTLDLALLYPQMDRHARFDAAEEADRRQYRRNDSHARLRARADGGDEDADAGRLRRQAHAVRRDSSTTTENTSSIRSAT